MKLKSFILFLFATIVVLVPANIHAADSAEKILSKCAAKVNESPSISIKFTLTYSNQMLPCDIIISKNKYRLSSKEMQVWYDGTTQWTYITSNKQLSITEPTMDELLESNPFAIINNYAKAYTSKVLNSKDLKVELTAKSKSSSISKAVVSINAATYLPSKIEVTLSNGTTMTATAGTTTIGKLLPVSTFIYNKAKFPAEEIVDLR